MKQSPAVHARLQIGGRPMPEWFSKSIGHNNSGKIIIRNGPQLPPTLPPLPVEPPPQEDENESIEESEYEEIDHLPCYSNSNDNNNLVRRAGVKWICSLCGNCNPAVRCEMCNNQVFCAACNEMYHRHPKRHSHVRKLLENVQTRPPLPPKAFQQQHARPPPVPTHMHLASQPPAIQDQFSYQNSPQDPGTPVPPPRRNRKFGSTSNLRSTNNSPTLTRKLSFDPFGSLKRFVKRPLPGIPQEQPTGNRNTKLIQNTPKAASISNLTIGPVANIWKHEISLRRQQQQLQQILTNSAQHDANMSAISTAELDRSSIPLTVLELSNHRGNNNNCSRSFANLNENHNNSSSRDSRDSGYRGWGEDEIEMSMANNNHISQNMIMDDYTKQRTNGHSLSATNLNRISTSNPATGFATLQRPRRNTTTNIIKPPMRPPPPVPPRELSVQPDFSYPSHMQRQFQQQQQQAMFQSAIELNNMGTGAFVPWERNLEPSFNRQQRQGLHEYPSSSWNRPTKPTTFGPPMTESEMERQLLEARRGSAPPTRFQQQQQQQEDQMYRNEFRPIPKHNEERRNIQQQRPQPSVRALSSPATKKQQEQPKFDSTEANLKDDFMLSEAPRYIISENPEGPWACEHCTFVNPKSLKICTICCKTPLEGYRSIDTSQKLYGPLKQNSGAPPEKTTQQPAQKLPQKLGSGQMSARDKMKVVRSPPPQPLSSSEEEEEESDSSDESPGEDEEEILTQKQKISASKKSPVKNSYTRKNSQELRPNKTKPSARSSSPTLPGPKGKANYSEFGNVHNLYISDQGCGEELASSQPLRKAAPSKLNKSQDAQVIGCNLRQWEEKSSKGTSPPPQTISTQTYEELPAPAVANAVKTTRGNSKSKSCSASQSDPFTSTTSSSREPSPPRPSQLAEQKIAMSDKAMRYARRAQQQQKLKRSASAHLPEVYDDDEPWMIDPHRHPNYHHRFHNQGHHRGRSGRDYEGRNLYRPSSQHSLASDTRSLPVSGPPSRDGSPSGPRYYDGFLRGSTNSGIGFPLIPPTSWDRFPSPGDYFASLEDLVSRKHHRESIKSQEFELSRLLKEAEELNYSPEDVQVALRMCGDRYPIKWLQENWSSMVETVQTLATKYGREKGQESNDVGTISTSEAKDALRLHKGNVWAAVTECVAQRRKKFSELQKRGTFIHEDILTALTANHGNLDAAYVELSKAQLKPFLMRIWGPPSGHDNDNPVPRSESILSLDRQGEQHRQPQLSNSGNGILPQNAVQTQGKIPGLNQGISNEPIVESIEINQPVQGSPESISIPCTSKTGAEKGLEKVTHNNAKVQPVPIQQQQQVQTPNKITSPPPPTNTSTVHDTTPEHVKYDPEEDSFMDAISDYGVTNETFNNNNSANSTTTTAKSTATTATKSARKESLISNNSSSSWSDDPEITDENHVSHFIQNFLIPDPPKYDPIPANVEQRELPETTSIKSQEPEQEQISSTLLQSQVSPTPSSLSSMSFGTRTSSELEKLFDDPHQQLISPQHQLANLAKAMNLISEKLGVLLIQQDEQNNHPSVPQSIEIASSKIKVKNEGEVNVVEKPIIEMSKVALEQIEVSNSQGLAAPAAEKGQTSEKATEVQTALPTSITHNMIKENNFNDIKILKGDGLKVGKDVLDESNSMKISNSNDENPSVSTSGKPMNADEQQVSTVQTIINKIEINANEQHEVMGNIAGTFLNSTMKMTPLEPKVLEEKPLQEGESNFNNDKLEEAIMVVQPSPNNTLIGPSNISTAKPIVNTGIIKKSHAEGSANKINSPSAAIKFNNQSSSKESVPAVPLGVNDVQLSQNAIQFPNSSLAKIISEMDNNVEQEVVGELSILNNIIQGQPMIEEKLEEFEVINDKSDGDDDDDDEDAEEAELEFEGESGSESGSLSLSDKEDDDESFDEDDEENEDEVDESHESLQEEISDNEIEVIVDKDEEEDEPNIQSEHAATAAEMNYNEENIYEEIELVQGGTYDATHHEAVPAKEAKGISRISKKVKEGRNKTIGFEGLSLGESSKSIANSNIATTAIANTYYSTPSTSAGSSNKQKLNEKQIQQFLSAGKVKTKGQGELALKLIDMNFNEDDSLAAATECSSLYTALCFLQQECHLCAAKFSANQMISMLQCIHRCCRSCANEYFMVQIRDRPIIDLTCPFCKEPSNLNDEPEFATSDYFSQLDIVLKDVVSERYYEMFQRKLRDWALAKTPNFKWCSKCSSGFIMEPMQLRLVCPDCSAVTCAICLEPWDKDNHNHKDKPSSVEVLCEESSVPAQPALKPIVDFLNDNCIECPKCKSKFTLARGGCMHLTCSQCHFEFCSGCSSQFRMGSKCSENPFCQKLGLHAHHPRNCLFYLRDKEPQMLLKLLEDKNIPFHKEESSAAIRSEQSESQTGTDSNEQIAKSRKRSKCQVPILKETENGTEDDICGQETCPENSTTVCLVHYIEYLGLLIWQNGLDPISLLRNDDLETIIRRAHKKLPRKPYGIKDEEYRPSLLKVIADEIPL